MTRRAQRRFHRQQYRHLRAVWSPPNSPLSGPLCQRSGNELRSSARYVPITPISTVISHPPNNPAELSLPEVYTQLGLDHMSESSRTFHSACSEPSTPRSGYLSPLSLPTSDYNDPQVVEPFKLPDLLIPHDHRPIAELLYDPPHVPADVIYQIAAAEMKKGRLTCHNFYLNTNTPSALSCKTRTSQNQIELPYGLGCLSWNARGLSYDKEAPQDYLDSTKLTKVILYCVQHNIHIFFIQESYIKVTRKYKKHGC